MALSRERIADELLKILGLSSPVETVRLMIAHGIFRPFLPEIESADGLERLVGAEKDGGFAPDPIRRLASLIPREPDIAAAIAGRLRLSRRQARRLALAADPTLEEPSSLAYFVDPEAAVDRYLLAGRPDEVKGLADYRRPRLSISGGSLIQMGLAPGPAVAATMQAIEREWAKSGFPEDPGTVREMARRHVDQAVRSSK